MELLPSLCVIHSLKTRGDIVLSQGFQHHARNHSCCRALPIRHGSKTSQSRRRPMAPSWSARLALGVCGTDREIVCGDYGEAPPGSERLVLGHESLGEVIAAPPGSGFARGRPRRRHRAAARPGALPGLRRRRMGHVPQRPLHRARHQGLHGFGAERFRIEPELRHQGRSARSGELGVLLEPASVVAKAWDHIERIGRRFHSWEPQRLLVTGAGPVGLLAALMGAQRGYEVHVLDRAKDGPKPALVRDLGALYHTGTIDDIVELAPDVVIECTGAPPSSPASRPHRARAASSACVGSRPAARIQVRFRTAQPHDGAQQRRGVRLGQRQPQALRDWRRRRSARPTRPGSTG